MQRRQQGCNAGATVWKAAVAMAILLTLTGCGGGDGDALATRDADGSPSAGEATGDTPSGETGVAPNSNQDAGADALGTAQNPAEVGQWFTYGRGWSARLASVRPAEPGEVTQEAQGGGPYVVVTIEGRYDGDDASAEDMSFATDVEMFDEAFCDGISTSPRPVEVDNGDTAEYQSCQFLAPGEGTIDVVAYRDQSAHWGATYRVEGPDQDQSGDPAVDPSGDFGPADPEAQDDGTGAPPPPPPPPPLPE